MTPESTPLATELFPVIFFLLVCRLPLGLFLSPLVFSLSSFRVFRLSGLSSSRSFVFPVFRLSFVAGLAMKTRIMYIENKSEVGLNGNGRIGRIQFSKTGKTLYYQGKSFQSLKGGYKANYLEIETGDAYWISGPKRKGGDRLYGQPGVQIDEDVRVEYWLTIRKQPDKVLSKTT